MSRLLIEKTNSFDFICNNVSSDKSISHRCAIFSLLSDSQSHIRNYLEAEDTLSTLEIATKLGLKCEKQNDGSLILTPPKFINEPSDVLDCGNSGTAMRLWMGFLASKDGFFVLHGDKYLASRPMRRVANPLRDIGALIDGRNNGDFSPICIRGNAKLNSFEYESPEASAQVKSALILAALNSTGVCRFKEPYLSRDHSENMLIGMGANIVKNNDWLCISPIKQPLNPLILEVPSDPSSAFFFAVAAAIVPNASIKITNVLLNKTRIEAFRVLEKMGAYVKIEEESSRYESIGNITVANKALKSIEVSQNIAWLIDEIPALAVAFACADGVSVVKNAKELRVKECDRICAIVDSLRRCGIEVEEYSDGFSVKGGVLKKATIKSMGDHRIAMSFAVAGLVCGMKIDDADCINVSFPNFIKILSRLTQIKHED